LWFEQRLMPSEKAKENKQLVATCAACGKQLSVELLDGLVFGAGRDRRIIPVCGPCRASGWSPEQQKPDPVGSA
jgi:hypothetical protein